MRKLLTIVLTGIIVLGATGCGSDNTNLTTKSQSEVTVSSTENFTDKENKEEKDDKKISEDMSVEELLESAESGNGRSYTTLGQKYENGDGVEQNYDKALEYYLLSAEADNADFKGLRYAALLYYEGKGVEQDYDKAREYFIKAAEAGDISAAYYLGTMYEEGEGVDKDFSEAFNYYEMAVSKVDEYLENEKNNGPDELKKALCALARMYEKGLGVEKDTDKAIQYYQYAVDLGWDNVEEDIERLSK